jgi:hypothetical protein
MAVVTCKADAYYAPVGARCTFCGHRSYPPFITWAGSRLEDEFHPGPVIICNDCCREYKRGLMRDLVEVAQRDEFRKFCCQPVQPEDVRQ